MPARGLDLQTSFTTRLEGYASQSGDRPKRARGEGTLSSRLATDGKLRLVLEGYARVDTAPWYGRRLRLDLLERDEQASALSLTEAYLARRFTGKLGSLDVRLGKIVYAWGTADGFNPTDNLNAKDYTDLLRADKLGALSTHLGYQHEDLGIDLVLLPVFQPSRLPERGNRFLPELPSRVANPFFPAAGPPDLEVLYSFEPRRLPAVTWANTQEAVRVAYKLPGSEVRASYGRYISDLPAIDVFPGLPDLAGGTVPVSVGQRFERQDVIGLDFQTAIGEIGMRGEAARISFRGSRDPYGVVIFGLDHRWGDLVGDQDLTVILSFLSQRGLPSTGVGASLLSVETPFEKGVLVHATWETSDSLAFELSAFTAFSEGSYQDATLSYRVLDSLKLTLKAERLAGPRDTYLGANQPNSRVFAQLRFSF